MNANTNTTLDAVHAGIVAAIKTQFPDLKTVEAYRLDRKNLPTPACLIELTDMETGVDPDPATEQLAVLARFEARFVMSFKQGLKNPKLEVRKLASAFAVFAKFKRWGCPIGAAEVVGIFPDDFDAELDQFECFRVEWQQVIHLGETIWTDSGIIPEPYYSWSPDIGIPNEPDYKRFNEFMGAPE